MTGDPALRTLYAELDGYPAPADDSDPGAAGDVVVPLRLRVPDGELRFFSTVTTFGTPVDITVEELSIESFFPGATATTCAEQSARARSARPVADGDPAARREHERAVLLHVLERALADRGDHVLALGRGQAVERARGSARRSRAWWRSRRRTTGGRRRSRRSRPGARRSRPPRGAPRSCPPAPRRTGRARPDRGARGGRARPAPSPGSTPTGSRSGVVHAASATRAPGLSTRRVSLQRRLAVGHQHVAPAAQHAVERRGRLVDPLGVDLAEAHVGDPHLLGALLRRGDHLGREVGGDQRAAGRDLLGGEEADLAGAGRQLEHLVARLQLERVDHPHRHGHRRAAQVLGARRPALGLLAPAGAALLAVCVGVGHVSSRRRSLPEGVRGSRVTSSKLFGTL